MTRENVTVQNIFDIFLIFTAKSDMFKQLGPAMSVVGQALDLLSKSNEYNMKEKISIVQSNVSCHRYGFN